MTPHTVQPPPAGVIIPAGGTGSRFGHSTPKQFLDLAGTPVLVRTCRAFLELAAIRLVVVAVPAAHQGASLALLAVTWARSEWPGCASPPAGSPARIRCGPGCVLPADIGLVLVHDAARPLVDRATIERCLDAHRCGAAIAAVPVADTLKQVDPDGRIIRTVDRSGLWQAQTPQGARRDLLERAYAEADRTGLVCTDEAALLEAAGMPVQVVEGSERNLKITRPGDLQVAAALLGEEVPMRIGHGFDAHRLVAGRKLILGGVTIDFELGLDGHSDADVVAHALTDALLGALGAGDIGRHFPDSDPAYKGIDSLLLLVRVVQLAEERGFCLGNADLTIVCQRPRLAPHLAAMQTNLARACRVEPGAINIKATTTEKMGYTGRGEGISAHAVVLLKESAWK